MSKPARANLQLTKESVSRASKQAVDAIKKVVLFEDVPGFPRFPNAPRREEEHAEHVNSVATAGVGVFVGLGVIGLTLYLVLNIWGFNRLQNDNFPQDRLDFGRFANMVGWFVPFFAGLPSIIPITTKLNSK